MRPPVIAENSIRSENTGVPIIREIMVATTMTMSSLFAALFALLASSFEPVSGELLWEPIVSAIAPYPVGVNDEIPRNPL
ncbi:MAG: hypothetical protein DMG70_15510 [Acidobacteria bacterium]|nr:MAG: hypothetical protein DMG70_15510 [Acidobacteriota bacterium]PYY07860.1 MAG: hypothetical protein DMG69_17105 [Acidobacteriota bacterium]